MSLIAETAVNGTAYSFDILFSYIVPESLSVERGCRVLVPFGKGNSHRTGVVMKIRSGSGKGLKKIISAIDDKPVLSEEMLELALYLHDNTFCTYYNAVKAMLPPAMNINAKEKFILNENFSLSETLSDETKALFEELRSITDNKQLNDFIREYITKNGRKIIDELCENGAVDSDNIFRQKVGDAVLRMVRLTDDYISFPENFKLTAKQKTVVEFLSENTTASVKETAYMCGVTDVVISNLVRNGVAEEYETETFRHVEDFSEGRADINSVVLSDEQQAVYNAVYEQIQTNKPAVYLLHGVTGSGKTSVFEKLISGTVLTGRQVLVLIPEISLTPQILKRFRSLFGERVAVIHSGLSLGQRLDEYKRIKYGRADIVVGTRSAVFAPLDNIGLIIMDEEGERSYKSDISPRYDAHDIAKKRCAYHGSTLLLASATPSVESYYLAEKNIYRLVKMKKRYQNMPLPKVSIIDMNEERENGNMAWFSRQLVDEINSNLANGEQSILLLNRRGYHTIISCVDCGQAVYCLNCTVPLTYHKKNERMMCHYCGYSCEPVTECPACSSKRLKMVGFGTQRLEDELNMYFPNARILRMDADTTFSRYSYEKNFTAFRNGEYDIMIGTQMIGKGLDFPNVTLVGVLSADKSLYAGDFRSYERTFSLITQVVGRSGRGERSGRAVLQTFVPEHYIINLASSQNYEGFYKEEIARRRAMIFPPVCDICVFCFSGNDDISVQNGACAVWELMRKKLDSIQPKTPVQVIRPIKCFYGRIKGRYRWQIIMKCKNTAEIRDFISSILKDSVKLNEMNKISVYADMNGEAGLQ
ncbi:MAG: primosomal protein N' [Ruminococcus flavefaciens]|nr:primosomal protein N' [Ruminococcus flavefaciens]